MARFFVLLMIFTVLVLTNQVTAEPYITQSEFEAFKRNVEVLQERLQNTEQQLFDTTSNLQQTKLRLDNSVADLQTTKKDLQTTKHDLKNTKQDLQSTKQDLKITKQDLQTTKQDLQTTKQDLSTSQEDLRATQSKLQLTEERIDIIAEKQQTTPTKQDIADEEMTKSQDSLHKTLNKLTKSQVNADDTPGSKDLTSDFDKDRKLESTVGVVAFSAHRTNNIYWGGTETAPIPFEVIDYVIGPGYDTVSSVFTAPVGGLYFFAAGLRDDNGAMYAYITINGINWRFVNRDNGYDTASMSGVAQLQAGDTVSVDLAANKYINCDYNLCHFDGYLLYEQL